MYHTQIPINDIAAYAIYDGLDRVLATVAPRLPTIDASPTVAIQLRAGPESRLTRMLTIRTGRIFRCWV